ncbi:cobalamin biosynthesis protein CobW [Thiomicrorhabdus immobilis]|uniref:Cobalamin biosynthesis protein CobW n=1 Tax=Thiomicrorhabdus immobilis TaxID=2791037 RepID=A0ABN6CZQ7_9GAMM|nr:CobW family GTP-binding protein [Thiomicrorhabdus immobilis]BCN94154.1 cobalamin biosynthesis protein CobW [Thiomicrorhabdus immobilis]
MHTPLPVHLITGLLGSGKTTCLKQLITQKPATENWLVIINEFGEVDIDASHLSSLDHPQNALNIQAVSGGCICCTAQIGLVSTINQQLTRSKDSEQAFDRIWIEPTGLGHPAKIIDALQNSQFAQPLALQKIVCVITPQQLTQERWQKSTVMRDLVTLADTIILNKTDLSDDAALSQALHILQQCYPPKTDITQTQNGVIALDGLLQPPTKKPFCILTHPQKQPCKLAPNHLNMDSHQHQSTNSQLSYPSRITATKHCFISENQQSKGRELLSMGWIWNADVQFNRVLLKRFFEQIAPSLIRAKGIIKTGKEWQLINWSDGQLKFEDIAWRQDSRLECLFDESQNNKLDAETVETWLIESIHHF